MLRNLRAHKIYKSRDMVNLIRDDYRNHGILNLDDYQKPSVAEPLLQVSQLTRPFEDIDLP